MDVLAIAKATYDDFAELGILEGAPRESQVIVDAVAHYLDGDSLLDAMRPMGHDVIPAVEGRDGGNPVRTKAAIKIVANLVALKYGLPLTGKDIVEAYLQGLPGERALAYLAKSIRGLPDLRAKAIIEETHSRAANALLLPDGQLFTDSWMSLVQIRDSLEAAGVDTRLTEMILGYLRDSSVPREYVKQYRDSLSASESPIFNDKYEQIFDDAKSGISIAGSFSELDKDFRMEVRDTMSDMRKAIKAKKIIHEVALALEDRMPDEVGALTAYYDYLESLHDQFFFERRSPEEIITWLMPSSGTDYLSHYRTIHQRLTDTMKRVDRRRQRGTAGPKNAGLEETAQIFAEMEQSEGGVLQSGGTRYVLLGDGVLPPEAKMENKAYLFSQLPISATMVPAGVGVIPLFRNATPDPETQWKITYLISPKDAVVVDANLVGLEQVREWHLQVTGVEPYPIVRIGRSTLAALAPAGPAALEGLIRAAGLEEGRVLNVGSAAVLEYHGRRALALST